MFAANIPSETERKLSHTAAIAQEWIGFPKQNAAMYLAMSQEIALFMSLNP